MKQPIMLHLYMMMILRSFKKIYRYQAIKQKEQPKFKIQNT